MVVLAGMNILAAARTFHQQQEKAKALKEPPPTNNNNNNNAANLNHHLLLNNNKNTTPLVIPLVFAKKSAVSPGHCSRIVGSSCPLPMAVSPGKKRKVVETQGEQSSSPVVSVVREDKVEGEVGGCCLWKGCGDNNKVHNLLEHIQTVHVSKQTKGEGFFCLWEGCKMFSRKSSIAWLEHHIPTHAGPNPFKCIFPGCGQSFSLPAMVERHVNSHISTPGGALNLANRKMESSPFKGSRRKKQRCRKQRINIGQHVDYFDKRVMEVIKQRLATSVDVHAIHAHHATFRGEVVAKCTAHGQEPQVLVQWFPGSILPDEWVRAAEYRYEKRVPLTQLPREKLPLIFSTLFGSGVIPSSSGGQGKNRRKWSSNSSSASNTSLEATTTKKITSSTSTCGSISSASSTSSGICSPLHTPSPTSVTSITDNESDEGIASCSSANSPSKFSLSSSPLEEPLGPPLEEEPLGDPLLEDQEEYSEDCEESLSSDEESEWAVDALLDSFILS